MIETIDQAYNALLSEITEEIKSCVPEEAFSLREWRVIDLRLGMTDGDPRSRKEVAMEFCISEQSVKDIEASFLDMMGESKCHRVIASILKEYDEHDYDEMDFFKTYDPYIKPLPHMIFRDNKLFLFKLCTATIELSEETFIEYGENRIFREADLIRNTNEIIGSLNGRCKGLCLNLCPENSIHHRDGEAESRNLILNDPVVTTIGGSISGSVKNKVSVSATVYKPDAKKLRVLFRKKLPYDITSITYGIYPIFDKRSPLDIWEEWINSVRNNFTVLYSDKKEGITIMLMKDVYLTAKFDEETGYINLKLSTRHPYQMEYKMREDIISDLINAITSDFLEDDDE